MRRRALLVALLPVPALAAIGGAGLTAAGGGTSDTWSTHAASVPDWFLPIADAYDRNPAITPAFDFASLYDARPESYRAMRREGVTGTVPPGR